MNYAHQLTYQQHVCQTISNDVLSKGMQEIAYHYAYSIILANQKI